MNWALVPSKPSETRLFAPGKGAEDFAFINIHIIKRALLEVARRWHHLVGSHTREAETYWYGTDRCVDTEERKWDGEVKLWWTAQCWSAVFKSDSESSTQEIVLCAAPVNENNEWKETRQEWVWSKSHVQPAIQPQLCAVMHGHSNSAMDNLDSTEEQHGSVSTDFLK